MIRPASEVVGIEPVVRALVAMALLGSGLVGSQALAAPVADASSVPVSGAASEPTIFVEDFESRHVFHWDVHVGLAPPDPIDMGSAVSKTAISLPGGGSNATERSHVVHYLGTGKSIDSSPRRQVPYRAYFASCAVDTANPKMFVSLTLADTSAGADPDYPEIGSVFETRYDPVTGLLTPTGNQAVLDLCNQTHGITASSDCSRVAVLCATANEEPVSATYPGSFRDLVEEGREDYFYTAQTDNESIIDGIAGLTQAERQARYQYNGEMWLLEWDGGEPLSEEPEKFVIHKGFGGGNPWSAPSLVYSETDNSYGAAFATNLFDTNHGGRHWSAALMIVEREGWKLNPDDRGWGWL
ncbi:MAG: hypothetical protein AAGE94_19405, partial [Acidobacteriota bacterium]